MIFILICGRITTCESWKWFQRLLYRWGNCSTVLINSSRAHSMAVREMLLWLSLYAFHLGLRLLISCFYWPNFLAKSYTIVVTVYTAKQKNNLKTVLGKRRETFPKEFGVISFALWFKSQFFSTGYGGKVSSLVWILSCEKFLCKDSSLKTFNFWF